MDVFVARQPIFDRAGRLYAYELLFRNNLENEFGDTPSSSATTQVMSNSLLSIGLENTLCGKKAFINFDRDLLVGGQAVLPPEIAVLEILETVEPDAELMSACRKLQKQGYTIALDDFTGQPHLEPLTGVVQVIKVDMRNTTTAQQESLVKQYRRDGIAMLAEKVETHEELAWAKQLGYDLFQGFFFARPQIIRGKQIPAAKINCLRLLRETQQEELNFRRLEKMISEDVALSYKLLRYINSALFAHYNEIHSIGHALTVLGETETRHWVALAALPEMAKDKPGELITHSLVRAGFCERLAQLAPGTKSHVGFLVGLFSLLDALLDVSLEEALGRAGVGAVISGALLGAGEESVYSGLHKLIGLYERGAWEPVRALAGRLGIKASDVAMAYTESTVWAQQALGARSDSRSHVRRKAEGTVRVEWRDAEGRERTSNAKLVNVSATGLQVRTAEEIPVHTAVLCHDPETGISRSGSIRYCRVSRREYLIGLGFNNPVA